MVALLKGFPVYAVLPASDLERARRWWEEKVGLTPDQENPGGLWYEMADRTWFFLYQTGSAGSAQNTQMTVRVRDIESVISSLRERGVTFEEYDFGEMKTVDGVLTMGDYRAAWFKDSEGNTVELSQPPAEG